jgi:cellobiose phosphorylase
MQYGYYDQGNQEYVIIDPRTPVKWINYIGTRTFGGFVDHTGGALICKDDPTYNRITKYIQQMPSSDFKGETLYLRLHSREGYRVFSPFYVPTLDAYLRYECRVGLGYTRWLAEFYNIRIEITVFVPEGAACELRVFKVTNLQSEPVQLDAVPLVEFTHPDALKQFTNADWVPQTMQCRAVQDGDRTLLVQYPFMFRDTRLNYLTANIPASSYETDRKRFLGANEYGSFRQPLSLQQPELSSQSALRGDTIAALLLPLGVIQPGETRGFITQLGQAENLDAAHRQIDRFYRPAEVEKALFSQRSFWKNYLGALHVQTPDADMNTMLNVFNPYQCYITRTWSRYLSYYQLGLGSRGIGMRDSCQDIMATLAAAPEEAKAFLRSLLLFQKRNGSAMHQFNPLTMEGSEGDSLEMADRPHYYSDDHLWLVLAVCAYLRETGNLAFLEEEAAFYERDKQGEALENGTVLDHLRRALTFTRAECGRHGLPLLGFADWNDTVNLPAGAESLFTAHLYGKALLEMIALMQHLGDSSAQVGFQEDYEAMRASVEAFAWDGAWYVRYFDDEGEPLGSQENHYNQISLNAQSWAVISGFAPEERARQAMDAVYERLNTRCGIKLSAPGFDGYDPKYGGVTTYPPGAKENGGIFLHPNPWAMIAETILGRGERAYEYYAQINPLGKNDAIETYECEPYVYAQNILGDEHPQFGLGRNSWLSGTASWCYQAGTQWILGIRPEYNGLRIDPCIPASWDGFTATRRFRGKQYQITVHNPKHVCKGVERITLNNQPVHNYTLIPFNSNAVAGLNQVEVWLGFVIG